MIEKIHDAPELFELTAEDGTRRRLGEVELRALLRVAGKSEHDAITEIEKARLEYEWSRPSTD
jgi:hypothetical protein